MRIQISGALCQGHGRCYSLAGFVREDDDQGYADPLDSPIDVPAGQEDLGQEICDACPESAIIIL